MTDLLLYLGRSDGEELRYALRSWEKNLTFRKLFVAGGPLPTWFKPDAYIPSYPSRGKMYNCWSTLRLGLKSRRLTNDVVIMMDDIFLLEPVGEWTLNHNRGTIESQIKRMGIESEYTRLLRKTDRLLKVRVEHPLSFEEHAPFYCNRKKLQTILNQYGSDYLWRSLYGNVYHIPTELRYDVKLQKPTDDLPKNTFIVSSNEQSFKGNLGKYIRRQFPNKSRWEK